MRKRTLLETLFLSVFLLFAFTPALAQEEELPPIPGRVEGTGTYFEVTDSEYLNVTLASSESIALSLESVPSTIMMHVEAAEGAMSSQVTLGGLAASTTYYMYEDSYENGEVINTDASGSFSWPQDLSGPHLVWLQPNPSTKFIQDNSTGGQCMLIGTWNQSTKTCTLQHNVYETIEILSNDVTLDGAGYTVQKTGSRSGLGIYANYRSGLTIKNVKVQGFHGGIYLNRGSYHTLMNNTASNNNYGIIVTYGSYNTLTENTVSLNNWEGISLDQLSDNTLTGNTAFSNNRYAIWLRTSSRNMLTGNTASNNGSGIYLTDANDNALTGNFISENRHGIYLERSSRNTLNGNAVLSQTYFGMVVNSSSNNKLTENSTSNNRIGVIIGNNWGCGSGNQIYNNNIIDNLYQAISHCPVGGLGDVFHLEAPDGGNFWSDWTTPDTNGDGFVDNPYVFSGGRDDLPWTTPNGWLNQAPVADAGENLQILSTAQAYTAIPGTASDPDEDVLEYCWLEGESVLLDWSPVGTGGEATLDLAALPYLALGSHELRLEVREADGEHTASDTMILTVDNSPPEVQPAPSSQVVEIGIDSITVVADVADFDGDTLSYEWSKGGESLASGSVATVQGGSTVAVPDLLVQAGDSRFPLGTHTIVLMVDDGFNDPVSASVSVEVTDSTAPSLSPLPSVTMLWPPNHAMVPVAIAANAFDNGGGAIALAVSVTSSEPPDLDGDGHTIPDYVVDSVDDATGMIELQLRSERAGKGEGRTYTVYLTATDESGNASQATVDIRAPHDRRKK